MRISYIYLKNYIGIFNGLERTELEINFSNNDDIKLFNLITGSNGSGKTTLLSSFHIFAGTMDDRTPIIPNQNGEKVVILIDGDNEYKIRHIYKANKKSFTIKSFISLKENKKWIELNENGNVTSFKEKVKELFDIEESHFKLLRIGSNVTNFIDLETAMRKKYISNFLPDVDPYLKAYKIITENWSVLKKNISTISDQIKKLDTEDSLENFHIQTKRLIDEINKNIEYENRSLGNLRGQITALDPYSNKKENYTNLIDDLKNKQVEIKRIERNLKSLTDDLIIKGIDLNSLSKEINKRNTIKIQKESELEKLNSEINNLSIEKEDEKNKLEENQINFKKYSKGDTLEDCLKLEKEYNENIKEEEQNLNDEFSHIKDITLSLSEINLIKQTISNCNETIKTIESSTNEKYITEIKEFKCSDCSVENIEVLENKILKIENNITNIKTDVQELSSKQKFKTILKRRPSNCKIDECPFIKEALKFSDVDNKINILTQQLENEETKLKNKKEELKDIKKKRKLLTQLSSLYNMITNTEIIASISELSFYSSKKKFIKNFKVVDIMFLEDYSEVAGIREHIKNIKENLLPTLQQKIEILKDKKDLIDNLKNTIKDLEIKIEKISNKLKVKKQKQNTLIKEINDIYDLISSLEGIEKLSNSIKDYKQEIIELEEKIKSEEILITKIEKFTKQIKIIKKDLEIHKGDLEPKQKELDKIKYNLKKLKELKKKKDELEQNFGKIESIKDALSPTKGIPVLFTSIYLRPIKRIANELLSKAYGGRFFIKRFDITEKDFFIEVQKEDGIVVKDVKLASQGEVALCKIAISLALLERSLTRYNILLFDEIDAELDSNNREAFLSILEEQLNKLGVEQSLIITHNNSFDAYPVGLILFKGHTININDKEFLKNKNVIFNAE